jgi:membrane dipeptidase
MASKSMKAEEITQTKPIVDFSKIPQQLHKYPASDRAKKIVHEAITMDSLLSAVPSGWSTPEAPEFHDVLADIKAAGFKVVAACPSNDPLIDGPDGALRALEFYLSRINEHPERYRIVRTTRDIDEAIAENKLGIFFTHQGIKHFGEDLDRVGVYRQLGYGYCLLAYNNRNWVGDGCYEAGNAGLSAFGKLLIDAYNRYGMVVDVSHCGERLSLDVCERSKDPVISSHSVAYAIAPYQRSISDERIKAIAATGGVCGINMVGGFVDLSNPDIVTTDMLFRHIDHMVNLVGIDHVGFGSDWIVDMNQTATLMQLPLGQLVFPDNGYTIAMGKKGIPTASPAQIVAALVDKLLEKGYSESDCKKFLGGNFYRVFQQVWR